MAWTVFIDGKEGTTGLRIFDRLAEREEFSLLTLPEEKRKDADARREAIHAADIAILCLPDAAARESVALAEGSNTRILDTSTAHRIAPGWAYGFPELSKKHRDAVVSGQYVAVPGCHASGFIALAAPLVAAGLIPADTLLSSRESGLRPITVSLYFLDSKTGELRAEQQTLALYEGQTRVNALLEALAQGPEDDSLVSLLPEDFAVISSRIENGVCYLNLPANVSLPENEAERGLMLSALEQSILSLGGVDEVQFLIEGAAEPDGYR